MQKLSDYDFLLPSELIAKFPPISRGDSRLLVLKKDHISPQHEHFTDIINHLNHGDILVINNTKVTKARLMAKKISGGKVELLIIKPLINNSFICLAKGLGKCELNTEIIIEDTLTAYIKKSCADNDYYVIQILDDGDLECLIKKSGKIPLPPYIKRDTLPIDEERYQTIYAKEFAFGAIAAPTAGLHFNQSIINALNKKGVKIVEITLHVGPGTFLPIKTEIIEDHQMHKEFFIMDEKAALALNLARLNKKRIVVVGTTAMRVVEQVIKWANLKGLNEFFPCEGETQIFIRPDFKFLAVNSIITNFHLPKSTLFLLICAVLGKERAFKAYDEAIKNKYRFFSYGDACFFDIF